MKYKKLLTVRETAEKGILSESAIRKLIKQNKIPGVQIGNRFYVNIDLLEQSIDDLCKK